MARVERLAPEELVSVRRKGLFSERVRFWSEPLFATLPSREIRWARLSPVERMDWQSE